MRGILPSSDLVPVPGVRPGLLGVATLQGQTVAVIDLCLKLGLSGGSLGPKPKVVIVEVAPGAEGAPCNRPYLAGFMVDRVCDVVRYRPRDLQRGMLRGEGRPRKLIDFDQLVNEDDVAGLWSSHP